jgi:hypothetical protein
MTLAEGNKHGTAQKVAEFKSEFNATEYSLYKVPATVQLINTWHQTGLSRGSSDYLSTLQLPV